MSTERKNQIEALVKETAPKADVIKRALERQAAEQAAKEEELVLERLREIDRAVNSHVNALREARQVEKSRRKQLTRLLEAKEQFEKDADWGKFMRAW